MNSCEFIKTLHQRCVEDYRHLNIDIVKDGFRPRGSRIADFCVVEHEGRFHLFGIDRRSEEGCPVWPGHEIFFCHASTSNFSDWEVHDPVMLIRPGTWEGTHVFAPFILQWRDKFVMAYTGLNEHLSQDMGIAYSDDLFNWKRCENNPISPSKGKEWSFWCEDNPVSCRDPHMLVRNDIVYMTYTAETREGASCIAMASTSDFRQWRDHGSILSAGTDGYEYFLQGGVPNGQIESSNLIHKNGKWYLLIQNSRKGSDVRNWIFESDRMDSFDYESGREFWPQGFTVEVVKEKGTRSLLATFGNDAGSSGSIKLGVVDWADEEPTARFLRDKEELKEWF